MFSTTAVIPTVFINAFLAYFIAVLGPAYMNNAAETVDVINGALSQQNCSPKPFSWRHWWIPQHEDVNDQKLSSRNKIAQLLAAQDGLMGIVV